MIVLRLLNSSWLVTVTPVLHIKKAGRETVHQVGFGGSGACIANRVVPVENNSVNMADAVFKRPRALVAPDLQADTPKDRLAHLVGKKQRLAGLHSQGNYGARRAQGGNKGPSSQSIGDQGLQVDGRLVT